MKQISIKLDNETYNKYNLQKEEYNSSWAHILGLGILALQDNPQLINRLQIIEDRQDKIERYIYELKHKTE